MAWLFVPARVHMVLAYGAPKEAFTAIAAGGPIVFPCSFVSTDCTVTAEPIWARVAWFCWHALWKTKQTNYPQIHLHMLNELNKVYITHLGKDVQITKSSSVDYVILQNIHLDFSEPYWNFLLMFLNQIKAC